MYPTRIGFQSALERIEALRKNGHSAEALVTSVFTLEKLIRRSIRIAVVARGFTSDQAERLLKKKGFHELKDIWDVFDRQYETLPSVVGSRDWQHIPVAVEMRNKLVHGNRVYGLTECESFAGYVVTALNKLHVEVSKRYERDPWAKIKVRRKPKLQWLVS